MGNSSDEEKQTKSAKSSPPPARDMNNYHVYPDWATVQAYYGPRLAVPPYMSSAVASSPAASAYMWAPAQSMIPHYGAPYAAFYAHYAHPGVPLVGTPSSTESPIKSSGNSDGVLQKTLRDFDGLAMSIGNGNADNNVHVAERRLSDSEDTDGSSDGSNGVIARVAKGGRKRSRQESPIKDVKAEKGNLCAGGEVGRTPEKSMDGIPCADSQGINKLESIKSVLDLKSSPTVLSQQQIPCDGWLQKERELKRERRKQSNRESARRSRLRKQAETEDLASKVQALTSDNMSLKSEVSKLVENSAKLKLENAALMEKLKVVRGEEGGNPRVATVNLLARVECNGDDERSSRSPPPASAKLHQLLDGVAAS